MRHQVQLGSKEMVLHWPVSVTQFLCIMVKVLELLWVFIAKARTLGIYSLLRMLVKMESN